MKLLLVLVAGVFAGLILGGPCQAEDLTSDMLQVEVWAPLASISPGELTPPPPPSTLPIQLLKEARWLISGMIFGWHFVYVPSDKTRQVAEVLTLKPLGEIPWGDPRLSVTATRVDRKSNQYSVSVTYLLSSVEQDLRTAWASAELHSAGGRGEWVGADSLKGRQEVVAQTVKAAVRNFLRPKIFNKPERIEGDVLLLHSPLIGSEADQLDCTAEFRLRLTLVQSYPVY